MMFYGLRDQIFYSTAGNGVILMDLRAGRFFGLKEGSALAFQALLDRGGEAQPDGDQGLAPLIESGYLLRSEESTGLGCRKQPVVPISDLMDDVPGKPKLNLTVQVTICQILASAALRVLPLRVVVGAALRIPARGGDNDAGRRAYPRQLAMAFQKAALLLGQADRCLDRSFAMFALLRRAGIGCELVIGLRHRPFGAHSWVQCGPTVLNDRLENVLHFEAVAVFG